ncbi:SAV_2336 N-terminal domain-related protein [Streptomyces sp. NPDC056528]|uniref:SAV_2336 N-terminal domain-related protein n=1 Tax=Streptomyces sp. NPDC056528 TaxID=3345854 RepID=UPI00367C1798
MSEALDRLLAALGRIPLPPGADAGTLVDALWLAASGTPDEDVPETPAPFSDETAPGAVPERTDRHGDDTPPDAENTAPDTEKRDLSARGPGATSTVRGVPASLGRADPLPDALAVGRAIQPFHRPWPRGGRGRLDIDATVDHYARGGPLVPLFRPAPEPWFEAVVVVDSSLSMSVWEETVRAVTRLLTTLGGFRAVHTWRLEWEGDEPSVRDHHGREVPGGRVPQHDSGIRGRRLVLLVSDCAARGWHTPAPWLLLREWGDQIPVALLDPLPQRLWRRSALDLPAVRVTAGRAGVHNSALRHTLPPRLRRSGDGTAPAGPWTPLPVMSCTPRSLGAWASTLMRADPRGCDAVLVPATGRPSPTRSGTAPTRRPDPARRAEAFTRTAPAPAVRLAVLCAGLPDLPLPLLHVLRDRAVPEARYADLAELLTSGLFAVRRHHGGDPVLGLHAGAREHLGTYLTTHDKWLTRAALSRHAAAHPYAPQGIAAVLHDALSDMEHPAETGAFAEKDVPVRHAGTVVRKAPEGVRRKPPEDDRPDTAPREDATDERTGSPVDEPAGDVAGSPLGDMAGNPAGDRFGGHAKLRNLLAHTSSAREARHAETLLRHLTAYLIARLPKPWGTWPGPDTRFDDLRAAKGSLTEVDVLDDLAAFSSPEGVTLEKPGPDTDGTGQDLVWRTPDGILSVSLETETDFSWTRVTDAVRSRTFRPRASGPPAGFLLVLDESDKSEEFCHPASCTRLVRRDSGEQAVVAVLRLQTRYGSAPPDSRAALAERLDRMHRLAGSPTYRDLVREAAETTLPVSFDPGTLAEWFGGHSVPADERAFAWLVGFLTGRAGRAGDATWSPYRFAALRHHALAEERRAGGPRAARLGRPVAELAGSTPGPYGERLHDLRLRAAVRDFVTGTGALVLLVGAPGSGRIRSSLEALRPLPDGYRVWEPADPAELAAELAGPSSIGPRTVVWLKDAARHLLDASDGGRGERISAALRERLRRTDRAPVLVLGLLTPPARNLLEASPPAGAPDPHAQARALYRDALRLLTPRVPGEEQINRYLSAPAPSRALLDAAIDARRCGHGPDLPLALLRAAAPHYLPASERHRFDGRLGPVLDPLRANGPAGTALLSRVRQLVHETDTARDRPFLKYYLLSDHLERYGREVRDGIEPPEGLWDALAAHASRHDLEAVALAALEREDMERAERFRALAHPVLWSEEELAPHDMTAPGLRLLLRSTDLREDQTEAVVDRALGWLRADVTTEEAQFVLNGLLSRTDLSHRAESEAARHALVWLDLYGTERAAETVLGPLLTLTDLSEGQAAHAVSRAFDWLGLHRKDDRAGFVLRPLLRRGDLSEGQVLVVADRALSWLKAREGDESSRFVLGAALRRTDLGRSALVKLLRIGFGWLRAVGTRTSAMFVLHPLLLRTDLTPEETRAGMAFALVWLGEHGATHDAQSVLRTLLPRTDLTPEEVDDVVRYTLSWLRHYGSERAARFVLLPLLARTDLRPWAQDEAMEVGKRWSLERAGRGEPDHGVRKLVDRVMKQEMLPDRMIMLMEMAGLGRARFSAAGHARSALRDLVSRVLPEGTPLPGESWSTGDGMVIVLPAHTEGAPFLSALLARLESVLRDHDGFESLRLRVALHQGPAGWRGSGWSGAGLIRAARLVESAPLRAALEAGSGSPLAVVISDSLFRSAFPDEVAPPAGAFRAVVVETKDGTEEAWISVAGYPEPPGIGAWARPPEGHR